MAFKLELYDIYENIKNNIFVYYCIIILRLYNQHNKTL